jgi:hypothetical protein
VQSKFVYEEQENAQAFFLPYIWTVAQGAGIVSDGSSMTTAEQEGEEGVAVELDGEEGTVPTGFSV